MEQQNPNLDAAIAAAGISMVFNPEDWDFDAATPRPIRSKSESPDSPPFLN